MRKLLKLWFMLMLFFTASSSVFAQNAPKCTEYKVSQAPVQCGPGYTGMKVPITTYTCPSKNPVLSYDTTGCVPVGTPPKNPLATNCSVTPGDAECMPLPKPSGCPAGKHWTTQGSGVAHCVGDDINCPFGTSLAHDFLGNPVCNPNTCPGNQVLQADGKSCACPSGTSWNGSSCIAIPVVCPAPKVSMKACPAGMTGKILISTTYSLPNCTEEKTEDFSQCKNTECPGPSTSYSACPAGYTGSVATTTNYFGNICTPVTNTVSNCQAIQNCPGDTQQVIACPVGYSGSAVLNTKYDLNNQCARSDSVDNSGCVQIPTCPNGANNYPACRLKRYYCAVSFQGYPDGFIEGFDRMFLYSERAYADDANISDTPIDFMNDGIGIGQFIFRYFRGQVIVGNGVSDPFRGWASSSYYGGDWNGWICTSGNGN